MPELPDLQAFSINLQKRLHNKKVKDIHLVYDKKANASEAELIKTLGNQALTEVYRDGKELSFKFKKDDVLRLHMMLKGRLYVVDKDEEPKYTILEVVFNDDTKLVLTDFQKAATVTLNPEPSDVPDAMSEEVNAAFLTALLKKKKSNIKTILLDQHNIKGIGNAYADEILWDAKISPFSIGNKISDAAVKRLSKSIKSVLKHAEKQILKKEPDIISGEVRDFLDIHNSKKTHSPTGGKIISTSINSRVTYYTEEQEMFE
ncbi:MAG TPA: DNA-formamidopyrimidine glycosylase family protein [Ohtaekwangia sp.]|uniref:DNA-formamidopyrimidine glycosylase family protein n=1 Tax=Ohtaekwangia sp. TaxID=2066019 RepID=UPI002F937B9A